MRRFGTAAFLALLVLSAGSLAGAGAPPAVGPDNTCLGVVHGGASSTAIFGLWYDPASGAQTLVIDIDGASGPQGGSGSFDPSGQAFAEVPLFLFGEHTVLDANIIGPDGTIPIDPAAFSPGGVFIVDDNEPICDPSTLSQPFVLATTTTSTTTTVPEATTTSTTSTTSTSTTTTSTTTSTTVAATETTAPATTPDTVATPTGGGGGDDGGTGVLPWIFIGIGGLGIIVGGLVLARGGGKNCDRERENLAAAQRRLGIINESLQEALDDLADHEDELEQLEQQLAAHNSDAARGHAGRGTDRTHAVGDQPMSGAEVDAHREYLESMIAIESRAVDTDTARRDEWYGKYQRAEAEVREAEIALAKCEEANAPTPPPTPEPPEAPEPPAAPGPGGPAIATTPDDEPPRCECEDGAVYSEAGTAERPFRMYVDFSIIVQVVEGSQRKTSEADTMAINLGNAAAGLDALGKALGAAGAGKSIAAGLGGVSQGSYVMGAGGLVKGTAEAGLASGIIDAEIPTSPPEAVVELVESFAKLGQFVSTKVGEWLRANELYEVRMTLFYQEVVATPYRVHTCVNGKWECQKIWQYDIGPLKRHGRTKDLPTFRLSSDQNRHAMNSTIARLTSRAKNAIAKSVQDRAAFDARHQPGPCE